MPFIKVIGILFMLQFKKYIIKYNFYYIININNYIIMDIIDILNIILILLSISIIYEYRNFSIN